MARCNHNNTNPAPRASAKIASNNVLFVIWALQCTYTRRGRTQFSRKTFELGKELWFFNISLTGITIHSFTSFPLRLSPGKSSELNWLRLHSTSIIYVLWILFDDNLGCRFSVQPVRELPIADRHVKHLDICHLGPRCFMSKFWELFPLVRGCARQ